MRPTAPYIVDEAEEIGSDTIIAHLVAKYRLRIDGGLTKAARHQSSGPPHAQAVIYWVMSYSRWKDEEYWVPHV